MKNSMTTAVLATLLSLPLLTGCNREQVVAAPAVPESPTAPDKPTAPDAPTAAKDQASLNLPSARTKAEPDAAASVGDGAIEAKAGDVSVKVPN
jgi:hypothetical protein